MLDKTWMMCTICSVRYWLERHGDRVEAEKGVSYRGGGGCWSSTVTDLINVEAVNRNTGNM